MGYLEFSKIHTTDSIFINLNLIKIRSNEIESNLKRNVTYQLTCSNMTKVWNIFQALYLCHVLLISFSVNHDYYRTISKQLIVIRTGAFCYLLMLYKQGS